MNGKLTVTVRFGVQFGIMSRSRQVSVFNKSSVDLCIFALDFWFTITESYLSGLSRKYRSVNITIYRKANSVAIRVERGSTDQTTCCQMSYNLLLTVAATTSTLPSLGNTFITNPSWRSIKTTPAPCQGSSARRWNFTTCTFFVSTA